MPASPCARLLAIPLALLASSTAVAIEEPSFRVLERDGKTRRITPADVLVLAVRPG